MTKCLRLTGMALILILVALAAALLQPGRTRDLNLDDDWKLRAIARRIHEKERLAAELIDGRLTLFEAAALFHRLNAEPPAPPPLALSYPGDSEEERLCRQVIGWAWHRLEKCDPGRANDLEGACEEELRRHKERHGTVVLPDPPP
jgi:hypothetical protein